MNPDIDLLHRIQIASPCQASWDEMRGDKRVRFCGHCRLNVYNLSAMEPEDAEALVREKEGRLCVRYYARPDGTMLAEDCPVGLWAVRRMMAAKLGALAAAFLALFGLRVRPMHTMGVPAMPGVEGTQVKSPAPRVVGSPAPRSVPPDVPKSWVRMGEVRVEPNHIAPRHGTGAGTSGTKHTPARTRRGRRPRSREW